MREPDLQGKVFEFYQYDIYCVKNNVIYFKGVVDERLTLLDILNYSDKIMKWFNIYLVYFYANRTRMSYISSKVWAENKIKLVIQCTGTHDLYSIERK